MNQYKLNYIKHIADIDILKNNQKEILSQISLLSEFLSDNIFDIIISLIPNDFKKSVINDLEHYKFFCNNYLDIEIYYCANKYVKLKIIGNNNRQSFIYNFQRKQISWINNDNSIDRTLDIDIDEFILIVKEEMENIEKYY